MSEHYLGPDLPRYHEGPAPVDGALDQELHDGIRAWLNDGEIKRSLKEQYFSSYPRHIEITYPDDYEYDMGAQLRAEQQPLPERKVDEAPLTFLNRVLAPDEATKASFKEVLDEKKQQLRELYFDDEKKLKSIEEQADVVWWRFAGAIGDPLPLGLEESITSQPEDRRFQTKHHFSRDIFSSVAHAYSEELQLREEKYEDAIREVYHEVVEQTPACVLLRSFMHPPDELVFQEQPLSEYEKSVREVGLRNAIATRYSIDAGQVEYPESGGAYREFMPGKYALDEAAERKLVRLATTNEDDAAFEHFAKFAEAGVRQAWAELYPTVPYNDQGYRGGSSRYGKAMTKYFDQYCPEQSLPKRFALIEYMLERARKAPDERGSYSQAIEDAINNAVDYIALPADLGISRYIPTNNDATLAWLRQNVLPEYVPPGRYELLFAPTKDNSMVSKDVYERESQRIVAQLTIDNRNEYERQQPTLCVFAPRTPLPEANDQEPTIRLWMEPGAIIKDKQPWLAGYRLVSETAYVNGAAEYEFIRDEYNPYDVPKISIENARSSIGSSLAAKGLTVLERAIMRASPLTIDTLAALVGSTSMSYIPERPTYKVEEIRDGVLYTQCIGVNKLLNSLMDTASKESRVISGYVLQPGKSYMPRLQHDQTLFMHEGKRYLLDPTPNGEVQLPETSIDPIVLTHPDAAPRSHGNRHSMKLAKQKDEAADTAQPNVERARAEATIAAHNERMQVIQAQLEQVLSVRLGIRTDLSDGAEQLYKAVMQYSLSDEDPLRHVMRLVRQTADSAAETEQHLAACRTASDVVRLLSQLSAKERQAYTRTSDATLDVLANYLTQLRQEFARMQQAYEALG